MRYIKTINLEIIESMHGLKVGQWIKASDGVRGQYLGSTSAGVYIVRYQNGKFGKFEDTRNNSTLRAYAKQHGAK